MANKTLLERLKKVSQQRQRDRLKLSLITVGEYGQIQLVSMNFNKLMELVQTMAKDEVNMFNYMAEIVYTSIPELREQELLDLHDCADDPYDIVFKIFTAEEVSDIFEKVCDFNGVGKITEEDVKNL